MYSLTAFYIVVALIIYHSLGLSLQT